MRSLPINECSIILLKLFWKSFMLAFVVFHFGCASKVLIQSTPEKTDVYIRNTKTGAEILLGQTPITKTVSEIQDQMGNSTLTGEFITYKFKKEKFIDQEMLVPISRWNTASTQINVEMVPAPIDDLDKNKIGRDILNHLLLAQKFVHQGLFERAKIELDKTLKLDPKVSWAYLMLGQIEYLSKQPQSGLKYFEKALEIDPQNEQAQKMISIVQQRLQKELNR